MAEIPSAALLVLRNNLKTLFEETPQKWTEPSLAKVAGIDQKTIWRVMRGSTEPTLDTVSKLAKALGVDVWQLFTPGLVVNNPPMLEREAAKLRKLYDNLGKTKEAIEGALSPDDHTRRSEL